MLIANKSRVIYLLFLEEKGKNTRLHLMSCKFEERSSSHESTLIDSINEILQLQSKITIFLYSMMSSRFRVEKTI